jgi:probable phosphoglycerate mutase
MRFTSVLVAAAAALLCASSSFAQSASRAAESRGAESRGAASRPAFVLYAVRHGEAVSNVKPSDGLSDEEKNKLTPKGEKQAAEVAERLKGVAAVGVFASPAGRAQRTAEAIAKARGGPAPTTDVGFAPLKDGVGDDGKPYPSRARQAAWRAGKDVRPKDGESLDDVRARAAGAAKKLAEAHPGGAAIVVCHGEVVAALLAEAEGGTALERLLSTSVPNASVHVFEVVDGALKFKGPLK